MEISYYLETEYENIRAFLEWFRDENEDPVFNRLLKWERDNDVDAEDYFDRCTHFWVFTYDSKVLAYLMFSEFDFHEKNSCEVHFGNNSDINCMLWRQILNKGLRLMTKYEIKWIYAIGEEGNMDLNRILKIFGAEERNGKRAFNIPKLKERLK